MTVDPFREQLSAYIDGELTISERRSVESHLSSCSGCQAELESLSALVQRLRALPIRPAPQGVEVRVIAIIERRAAFNARLKSLVASINRHTWSYTLAGSGLAALVLALTVLPIDRRAQPGAPLSKHTQKTTAPARGDADIAAVSGAALAPSMTGHRIASRIGAAKDQASAPAPPLPRTIGPAMLAFEPTAVAVQPPSEPSDSQRRASFRLAAAHGGAGPMAAAPELDMLNAPSMADAGWDKIALANADSIFSIRAKWRVYDAATQKPLFQRVLPNIRGVAALAFVRLKSGQTVRWLTFDDDGGRNVPIQGTAQGEGVVADTQGDVLTSKRLVAGWTSPFHDPIGATEIFEEQDQLGQSGLVIDTDSALGDAEAWAPQSGGYIFAGDAPTLLSKQPRALIGRNTTLNVFDAKGEAQRAKIAGASSDADAVRLLVDPPPKAKPIDAAPSGSPLIDRPIMALGGTHLLIWQWKRRTDALAAQLGAASEAKLKDSISHSGQNPPRTTLTGGAPQGLSGRVGAPVDGGGRYQLHLIGDGNEAGSPVFDQDGKVVGLLTERRRPGDARPTYDLTPIHWGLALLPAANVASPAGRANGDAPVATPDRPKL